MLKCLPTVVLPISSWPMRSWQVHSSLLVITQNASTSVQDGGLRPARATSASLAKALPSQGGPLPYDCDDLLDILDLTRLRARYCFFFPSWYVTPRALMALTLRLRPDMRASCARVPGELSAAMRDTPERNRRPQTFRRCAWEACHAATPLEGVMQRCHAPAGGLRERPHAGLRDACARGLPPP